jgi:hypothetical protein
LHAETDIAIDPRLSVGEGIEPAQRFEADMMMSHLRQIRALPVDLRMAEESSA